MCDLAAVYASFKMAFFAQSGVESMGIRTQISLYRIRSDEIYFKSGKINK